MRLRAFRALAATTAAFALVVAGSVTAHAATPADANILTAASARWDKSSGVVTVSFSWEDRRTAPTAAPGAVFVYLNTGKALDLATALPSTGSYTFTNGNFSVNALPAAVQVSVTTYSCWTNDSCRSTSSNDSSWKVTLLPGGSASYTRPMSNPAPAPTSPTPTSSQASAPAPVQNPQPAPSAAAPAPSQAAPAPIATPTPVKPPAPVKNPAPTPVKNPAPLKPGKYVSARGLLGRLAVREEDHSHRYNRSVFSYDNSYDADGDGCYTRKEVLIRDAIRLTKKSASCSVAGTWRSLYDNKVTNDVYSLEIDHLVALAEAWHSGAYKWSHAKQIAFGNDIGYVWDLQAVTGSVNQAKGDGDPAEWLPAKNRCTYAKAWIGVKYRWGLPVDRAEKAALVRQLAKCPSLKVLMPGTPNIAKLVGHGEIEPIGKV